MFKRGFGSWAGSKGMRLLHLPYPHARLPIPLFIPLLSVPLHIDYETLQTQHCSGAESTAIWLMWTDLLGSGI